MSAVTWTEQEVASQPDCWRVAARRTAPELAAVLTAPGPLAIVGCGPSWFVEQSVVQTRFATSVVAAARVALGADVEEIALAGEAALAGPVPAVLNARQTVFLGSGWSLGLANEAALKLREATLAWSESYPAME